MPADQHQCLSRHNIFIIPSRLGFAYLFLVLILFLFGTNYQNNIIILLSYLMVSIFMTSMLTSFFNLSGLRFYMTKTSAGFVEGLVNIPLEISSDKNNFDLNFSFEKMTKVMAQRTVDDLVETRIKTLFEENNHNSQQLSTTSQSKIIVNIPYRPTKRGLINVGRLKVSSEYAFGLFTTWTKLDFGHQCTVYPAAKACVKYHQNLVETGSEEINDNQTPLFKNTPKQGVDDFVELKNYRQEEPLSRIAWKQLARGQGHFSKHYQAHQTNDFWLRLEAMPAQDSEVKLQLLCWLVLTCSKAGQVFGVDLGQIKVSPKTGSDHEINCLLHLAIYPQTLVVKDD